MSKKRYNLSNISKEFDELVEIKNSLTLPIESTLISFGFFPKNLKNKIKKLSSLSEDQYFAVVNAADARKTYGNDKIGNEIYNKNKLNYFISKKLEDICDNLLD
jgi:hypothetical protein